MTVPALPARHRTLLDRVGGIRAWHWLGAGAGILLLDYATGPAIQFPLLFVLPVALATGAHGLKVGAAVATLLPLARLSLFVPWEMDVTLVRAIDALVDVGILLGFAIMVDRLLGQQRAIRLLEGLLPICSFCKRIREEGGTWRPLESYIAERSDARFSHTFCAECGRKHYPGMTD